MTYEQLWSDRQELLMLVAAMREAQKLYFKTRSKEALIESKRLEALVDAAIQSEWFK